MKKYKLPKVFSGKWVAALRSGEYKQATTQLYRDGGYCCLGVACKVNGIEDSVIYGSPYPSLSQVGEGFF